MYSVVVRRFGGPEVLELVDGPVPEPGDGQVRITVAASSVNAIDLSARAGRLTQAGLMAAAEQIGLGWDVSGCVDEVQSLRIEDPAWLGSPVCAVAGPAPRKNPQSSTAI